jgi:Dual OB-containing domain
MSYIKRIVCLANSYKTGGTCIAGREVLEQSYGPWIRPVSARPTAEVMPSESRYEDNSNPRVLDIVDVPLLAPAPQHHQTENHIIDTTRRWKKVGELHWNALAQLCEQPSTLWINRDRTSTGAFNCMSQDEAATQRDSLVLIKPHGLAVEVGHSLWDGKRTYRGNFKHNAVYYSLSITDPLARSAFAAKQEGDYPVKDAFLCVSLTEPAPRDGRCHKLVAAIIAKSLL